MKYKVGDKVRIQPLEWYQKELESAECYLNIFDIYWCSREMTISKIEKSRYLMEEDGQEFYWTDEMIEGLVEEESTNYSKVIDNGVSNPIIAKTSSATIDTDKGFYSYSDSDGNLEMEWNLPQGYQFKDEHGNVINATKIVLEKKKKEYPKTYGYCCDILECCSYNVGFDRCETSYDDTLHNALLALRKLLICRDAYWKIAREEMGLKKPWEPMGMQYAFSICRQTNEVVKSGPHYCGSHTFEFPTEEMRDAFYENFKELIEQCKELL